MKKRKTLFLIIIVLLIFLFSIFYFLLNENKKILNKCYFEKNDIELLNIFFKNSWYNWNKNYWCNLKKIKFNLWINGDTIIPEIWKLNNLEYLDLSSKWFVWIIPKELWNLTNLNVLLLQNNELVWEIPNEFKKLKKLEVFNVSDNNNLWWELLIDLFKLERLNTLELLNTKIKVLEVPKNDLDIFVY